MELQMGGETLHPDWEGTANKMGGSRRARSQAKRRKCFTEEGMDNSVKCCREVKRDKPEKCSLKLVTGYLGKGSLGGGKARSRPSRGGKGRGQ